MESPSMRRRKKVLRSEAIENVGNIILLLIRFWVASTHERLAKEVMIYSHGGTCGKPCQVKLPFEIPVKIAVHNRVLRRKTRS